MTFFWIHKLSQITIWTQPAHILYQVILFEAEEASVVFKYLRVTPRLRAGRASAKTSA